MSQTRIGAARQIGVAVLGNGFMARAHVKGLIDASFLRRRKLTPRLVSICGRNEQALEETRERYGFERSTRDWREQVADPSLGLFHNTAPNALHAQPTIAALAAGKHVLCEKPLGRSAEESFEMWRAAARAGVVHMCGFNFRFAPAIRLAYELLQGGEIGEIVHFRAQFLESYGLDDEHDDRGGDSWRDSPGEAAGAIADLGSHIVDLARFLAGEPSAVQAQAISLRAKPGADGVPRADAARAARADRAGARPQATPPGTVDDAFGALFELASGASGVIEASRVAGGMGSRCAFEIDGTRGSLRFSSERLNELEHARRDRVRRTIRATGEQHPFMEMWWPHPGHPIGWGDTFTHEVDHLLAAIAGDLTIAPLGADFEDGYRCAEICDAVLRAAASREREPIAYRSLDALDA